ncbi:MAG: radical SAM protein [Armatimonadetes bacterium]|nr:radical SAM protein [Armatimonadota bacterium]
MMPDNQSRRYITGFGKFLAYIIIATNVAIRYVAAPRLFGWSPVAYVRFLRRALILLLVFRHNKVVRVAQGYKLHLYLPAFPTPAFYYAIESKLIRTPARAMTVVFSMTKACSYKCEHCYQRRDGGPDLEEDLLCQTARAIQDNGVAMFDIEGGEPFVRYPRLLRLMSELDSRSEIWVNTTGAQLTAEMMSELKSAGLFGLMVSVHSPDAVIHDAFTGVPGSFDIACDALRLCRQMGVSGAVNCVLSEDEVRNGRLDQLMELACELEADYVQLIHPKPAGIWLGREEGMQSDLNLIKKLREEHIRYNSSAKHNYPSLAAQVFEEDELVMGCTCGGVDRFYVNATGEVQPCEFLNLSFGNVIDEPFIDIYNRMREYFATPCVEWLCCTQAQPINNLFHKHSLTHTPLPQAISEQLAQDLPQGKPTPLYKKLGIYK